MQKKKKKKPKQQPHKCREQAPGRERNTGKGREVAI